MLIEEYPGVYDQLRSFYRQDPAERLADVHPQPAA
jgi:Mlc titration factor MtfA (ptsG expression regulator)